MKKVISIFLLVCFFVCSSVQLPGYTFAFASEGTGNIAKEFRLPAPGAMVHLSPEFHPTILKGITVHPENPFQFDFIIGRGDSKQEQTPALKQQITKLVKYFLASLTIPEKNLWVNLSPYEKNRIIPEDFGKTDMGRDLLGEDYILKQITASLIYPEDKTGQEFWKKVYVESYKRFGTTNIPISTFNKVWIIPDQATVYENGNTAYVLKSHLKVMLEEDYLSLTKHNRKNVNAVASVGANIIRQIILPAIEKEVNTGKNFALLRQVNNSLILATWFKKRLRESLLGKVYVDQGKVSGVDQDPSNNLKIYQQYLQAYKRGVYNYIKKDEDRFTHQLVPRKYFSGGYTTQNFDPRGHSTNLEQRIDVVNKAMLTPADRAMLITDAEGKAVVVADVELDTPQMPPYIITPIPIVIGANPYGYNSTHMELLGQMGIHDPRNWEQSLLYWVIMLGYDFYQAKNKQGHPVWLAEAKTDQDKVWAQPKEDILSLLERHDFFERPNETSQRQDYMNILIQKFLRLKGVGNGPVLAIPEDAESRKNAERFMMRAIKIVFNKYAEGELEWPEMQNDPLFKTTVKWRMGRRVRSMRSHALWRSKQRLLQVNRMLTAEIVAAVMGGVLVPVTVGQLETISIYGYKLHMEGKISPIEMLATVVWAILVINYIHNRIERSSDGVIQRSREAPLQDKIRSITAQDRERMNLEYNAAFDRLGERFGDVTMFRDFAREVSKTLFEVDRYAKIGEYAAYLVDAENRDLFDREAAIMLLIKAINDQDPTALEKMSKDWEKRIYKGELVRVYLDVLKSFQERKRLYDETVRAVWARKHPHPRDVSEIDEAKQIQAIIRTGEVDKEYLDELFLSLQHKSEKERRAIVVFRYFGQMDNELRKIISAPQSYLVAYCKTTIQRTTHVITYLARIRGKEKEYGLTPENVEGMIKRLQDRVARVWNFLPPDGYPQPNKRNPIYYTNPNVKRPKASVDKKANWATLRDIDGHPYLLDQATKSRGNPWPRNGSQTGITGFGDLYRLGDRNRTADILVTTENPETHEEMILMGKADDGTETWRVIGGFLTDAETEKDNKVEEGGALEAILRILKAKAGIDLSGEHKEKIEMLWRGKMTEDRRATNNAWVAGTVFHLKIDYKEAMSLSLKLGGNLKELAWIPLKEAALMPFANHGQFIKRYMDASASAVDKAMMGGRDLTNKGGIDLNPMSQSMTIQGKGNNFALTSKQLKNYDQEQVSGFVPVIVAIKQGVDLSQILGV